MKERPIIFSGPMVRAILEGRKTQTRRVIEPQAWSYSNDVLGQPQIYARSGPNDFGDPKPILCPYGQPRDLLWVRETWGIQGSTCIGKGYQREFFSAPQLQKYTNDYWKTVIKYKASDDLCQKWWPSIHLPKWAARLWLRITNVRVERVQKINIDDCKAEGVICDCPENEENKCLLGNKGHFKILWNSINAKPGWVIGDQGRFWSDLKYPWKSNPWVWVIGFERVKP